jgi:hypothetical protein
LLTVLLQVFFIDIFLFFGHVAFDTFPSGEEVVNEKSGIAEVYFVELGALGVGVRKLLEARGQVQQCDGDVLHLFYAVLVLHQFNVAVVNISDTLETQVIVVLGDSVHEHFS